MTEEISKILPIIYMPLIFVVIGIFLFIAYRKSKVLAPEEIGALPIYSEQAGGRFNLINWSFPFVRVAVYTNFGVVSYWNHQIVLKKEEVEGVEERRGLFYKGLVIKHTRFDIPRKIIIWPRNHIKLKQAFEMSFN